MGIIQPKKYESLQLERFETLFNDVLHAYALTNESSHQLKATRVLIENLNDQIRDLNKQFELALIRYGKDYSNELSEINFSYQQAIKNEDQMYANNLKTLKTEFQQKVASASKALERLHEDFQSTTKQTNIDIKRALIDMRQRHEELDLLYEKEKAHYQDMIADIEDLRVSQLESIKKDFDKAIKENKQKDQIRQEQLAEKQKEIQKLRQDEQADYDEAVLKIKTVFNRVTIKLNQKIIQLQKQYNQKIDKLKSEIKTEIKRLNDQIDGLKFSFKQNDELILDEYKDTLLKYDKRIDSTRKEFEQRSDVLTKAFSRDITLNNSNLATYKDLNLQQVKALEIQTNENRIAVDKSQPDYKLQFQEINANYMKQMRALNNQLQHKILETKKKNRLRHRQYQRALLDSEYQFIQTQETLRLKIKLLKSKKDHQLSQSKLLFEAEHDKQMAYIRLLEKQLFLFNQTTQKEDQGPAIYPYESEALLYIHGSDKKRSSEKKSKSQADSIYLCESEILLAREIYDAEMHYRTLDNNYFKQTQSLKERNIHINYTLDELYLKHQRNILSLTNEHANKQTNLIAYLNMEYEKNSTNGFAKVISERKKEHEIYFQKQELHFFHAQDLKKEKRINQQKIINFKQRLSQQILEIKENKSLIDHDSTLELAKSNYTKDIGIRKAHRIIDTSLNETQRQRRLFDIYFQMLMAILLEHENFLILFRDIYQTSKTDEFISALPILEVIFKEQSLFKDEIIDALEAEAILYYQDKINELTAFKYMNLQEEIIEDYETEKRIYEDEIKQLEDQLKQSRSKVADYYQQIAMLENEVANLHSTKSIILKQIFNLKYRHTNKQERKTANNLRKELKTFQKEMVKQKTDIKHVKLLIKQTNKEINTINQNFKPLKNGLVAIEKNKQNKEINLKRNQYLEGKVYYDAISSIKSLTSKLKNNINGLYQLVYSTFKYVDKPDLSIKQFKLSFTRINVKMLKTKTFISLVHKKGIALCDHQHQQIKKEQLRIIHEYETSYRLTSSNIRMSTENRQSKIYKKNIELEKYKNAFLRMQQKQYLNQVKLTKMHFKTKMDQLDELLKKSSNDILRAEQARTDLLLATKTNIDTVIADQNNLLKQKTQDMNQHFSTQQKKLNQEISDNENEIETSTAIYHDKIKLYALKEKQARKLISLRLQENRTHYLKYYHLNDSLVSRLHQRMLVNNKQYEIKKERRKKHMQQAQQFKKMPLLFERFITVIKRKKLAKKEWNIKFKQLNQ